MIIRKKFRVEMGHIVRNCSSDRCAHSMHGHSAVIEVLLEGSHLDKAGMLYDFGLLKGGVKTFIDMFDHCYVFWDKDDPEYIKFIQQHCARWIGLPFNPTAEMLSLMFMQAINRIIERTKKVNGESRDLRCTGVIYHETESGYAHCCEADVETMWDGRTLDSIEFSDAVAKDADDVLGALWNGAKNCSIEPCATPFHQVDANPTGQAQNWR